MHERIDGLAYPLGKIDVLLREAARKSPARPAISTESGELSFRELDDAADSCAAALIEWVGQAGAPIAVCTALDPAFAITFYGISRSGNVIVTVNPLAGEDRLEHMLTTTGSRVMFVPPAMRERVERMRAKLPALETLIDMDNRLSELAARGRKVPALETATDPDGLACLHFTSGTTGAPKAVKLSHRNLLANAAQVAQAHRLSPTAITLNHLPAYHLMHLNSGIHARVTQVLCRDPDPVASIETARARGATHYYGLPARLTQLARDPRLAGLRLETVRGMLSGGSALPVTTAQALAGQFGIPVIQGYGLAESSPLTHCDVLPGSRWGSVGPPVAATECRIVDVERRIPLPAGSPGEVEVRGPQVMLGYLDAGAATGIGPDGWLTTGDIGFQDDDGWLFLVDRIKDVFKCDNELVSPAELERLLNQQSAVRDCVVVDHPDEVHGAVAHALVVVGENAGDGPLAGIAASVNDRVPYWQQVRYIQRVDAIPRSPAGKLERRAFRSWIDSSATHIPPLEEGSHHGAAHQQDDRNR